MRLRWSGIGLAVLLLCGSPLIAQAADEKVDFQVLMIRATTKNETVDGKLRTLAGQLKKQFKFSGYALEKTLRGSAQLNKSYDSALSEGYTVSLVPASRSASQIEVVVTVKQKVKGKEKLINRAKMKLTPGKTVLMGGWSISGGDRQILAISAR